MGISCILLWDHQEGYSTPQAMEVLLKRLESLGSRSVGTWSIDCETLYPTATTSVGNAAPPKAVHLLHGSEYPKSTFLVLDTVMNCMVADASLDAIFSNLKAFFAPRKGLKIEVKGHHHEVQQYAVKFGSLLLGATSRGVIVEVEDKLNTTVASAWESLTHFTRGLLRSSQPIERPSFLPPEKEYSPAESIVQYAYIFTQLRKAAPSFNK